MTSIYSIYYVTTIVIQAVMSCFSIYGFYENDINLGSISNVVFYITGFTSAILFFKLAQQWPVLIKKAEETEQSLVKLKFCKNTVKKSGVIAYVIMILALVEHILCINFNIKFIMQCLHESTVTHDVMENYVINRMPYVFDHLPYNMITAIVTEMIIIQATFIWSFTDVLTICFSIYITSYFNKLNEMVNSKHINNNISWSQLREYYSKIVTLVKEIDNQLSSFILLSFFTDLYYICLQLFNTLHRNYASASASLHCGELETKTVLSSPDYLLYYLYSFLFLVLRALFLFLFAAKVHVAAQESIINVYDVPSYDYDEEVQRFQLQLHYTKIALTGKVFPVTRNIILQIIGTITTYELVLLQFGVTPEKNTAHDFLFDNLTTTGF